jgi:UDP-GlcNAc:undecaprenyl-phosphate GlcNAc-1-phosphate transferase
MLITLFSFLTSLMLAFALTPLVRQLALRIGLVDQPNARKVHREPMPLLGGLAILFSTVSGALFFSEERLTLSVILIPAVALALIGFLDDRGWLHHQLKLMVAMPLAALWLIFNGVHLNLFVPLGLPLGNWVDYGISFFWIVGLTAAFSILDHMDGLASGVAAIACAAFALIASLNAQPFVAILAAALGGSALGFLRWNFNPAKIFMGDGGAMFLGFLCASLGLLLKLPMLPVAMQWPVPILILAIPIFDTTLVTISRLRRKLLPFSSPGKDHTAHRLANKLGQRPAVLILYSGGLLGGLLAWWSASLTVWFFYSILVTLGFVAVGIIMWLETLPYDKQQKNSDH